MHLPQAEVDFQEASARLKDPEMEMDTLCGPLKNWLVYRHYSNGLWDSPIFLLRRNPLSLIINQPSFMSYIHIYPHILMVSIPMK